MNQKKVIRRKNALARFTVMSFEAFQKERGKDANYAHYVARKEDELKSLKK